MGRSQNCEQALYPVRWPLIEVVIRVTFDERIGLAWDLPRLLRVITREVNGNYVITIEIKQTETTA